MTPSGPPHSSDAWERLARSPFVSLSTYRRSGVAVATAVWVAAVGDELVVTSERSTGKVKRLRNDSRVTLVPCRRMGTVEPGAVEVAGSARIAGSATDNPDAAAALAAKYGWQYRAALTAERLLRRFQRRPGERVIIRIRRGPSVPDR